MPIVSQILYVTKVSAKLRSFGLNHGTFFQCKNLYLSTERIPDIQSLTQIDGMSLTVRFVQVIVRSPPPRPSSTLRSISFNWVYQYDGNDCQNCDLLW